MSNDRELLEMAAKAAGLPVEFDCEGGIGWFACGRSGAGDVLEWWNPLKDDGNALRLSSLLAVDILHRFVGGQRVEALAPGARLIIEYCDAETRAAATRKAIVRAAAEIGRQMK